MSEKYTPSSVDSTPRPVAVNIDGAPDSSRQFSTTTEKKPVVQSSRHFIYRLLVPGAVAGAVLMGPEAADVARDHQSAAVRAEVTRVAENPDSKILQTAQLSALEKFFPAEDGGYDFTAAKKLMDDAALRTQGIDWQLPASHFISAEQAVLSADGKTAILEGQPYSFAKVYTKEGHVYILAAKPVRQDNLVMEDRTHMVKPMFMGGARYEENMEKEVLEDKAYSNVRINIQNAYKLWNTPREMIIGQNSDNRQSALLSRR